MIVLRNSLFSEDTKTLTEEKKEKPAGKKQSKMEKRRARTEKTIAALAGAVAGGALYKDLMKDKIESDIKKGNYPDSGIVDLLNKKRINLELDHWTDYYKNKDMYDSSPNLRKEVVQKYHDERNQVNRQINKFINKYTKKENRKNAAIGALAGTGLSLGGLYAYKKYKQHKNRKKDDSEN